MRNVRRVFATRNRFVILAILTATLVACVSSRGIQEFTTYRTAFDRTNDTANAILDQLAIQERALFRATSGHVFQEFNPDAATYYTDAGDPPGTGAFRNALATVDAYNDLLFALATGQSAASMVSQLGELQVNVNKALGDVAALAGHGGQVAAVGAALEVGFRKLKPFIELGLRYRSRQAFRVFVVENYLTVRQLLLDIRGGTTAIFPILTRSVMERHRGDITSTSLTAEEVEKVEAYRKLLSDWVLLIDGTIMALDHVNTALAQGPTVAGAVAGLSTIAIDLSAASDAARKDLAALAAN